MGSLRPISL
jgi:hypothetical protein